jgi:ABC-type glycerol-3-phosphate transport system substrate-binding protein
MGMSRKVTTLTRFLLLTVVMSLVFGCSSAATPTPAPASTPVSGTNAPSAAATKSNVTLTMWVHTDPNYEDVAKADAAAYEAATGVKITYNFVSWSDYQAKIVAAFASGTEPDIMQGVGSFLYGPKTAGLLDPVPADLQANFSSFNQASLAPVTWKGQYYGVPFNTNIDSAPVATCSADAIAKAGIDPSKWAGSWDTYISDLQKLTIINSSGKMTRAGLAQSGDTNSSTTFLMYFMELGGTFYGPDGKVDINNKYGTEALQLMSDMVNKYKVDSPSITTGEGVATGSVACLIAGTWYTRMLEHDFPTFKWQYVKMPLPPGNVGKPFYPGTSVWAWMVPAKSPNKAAAWDYIRWLNQPDKLLAMSTATGEIPANKTLWTQAGVTDSPRFGPFADILPYQVPVETVGPQDGTSTPLFDMTNAVLHGSKSIPDALAAAQQQINQMISGLPQQ